MSSATVMLIIAAIAVGALVPLQAGLNATLAAQAGHALSASLVNFAVATVLLTIVAVALKVPFPLARVAAHVPWYAWLGGVCGATLVFSTIVIAPRIGVSAFLSAMIVGTMVLSLLMDHFGVMVFREHPVTGPRLLGAALVVLGMLLVNRF